MKKEMLKKLLVNATMLASILSLTVITTNAQSPVKNIVLVHGSFADGSGWEGVYKILATKGYHVTAVQEPETSLDDDVAAVNRILDKQDGPTILVGHSYGGTIITAAGVHSKVAGLVYVAAYEPDAGETTLQLAQSAPDLSGGGVLPPDDKGFIYFDKAKFHSGFCADLSPEQASFMFASQVSTHVKCFITPITVPAWKTKPSWAIIPTEDKAINPIIQHTVTKRSGAVVTEIKGASHVVFISHPKEVAEVIETAAKGAVK